MPSTGPTSVASSGNSSPEKRSPPKAKRPRLSVTIEMPEGNDRFCWKCHTEDANVPCTTCQRSFHEYCVPSSNFLAPLSTSAAGDRVNAGGTNHANSTNACGKPKKADEVDDQSTPAETQDLHNFVCSECLSVIRAERDRREKRQRGPLAKLNKKQLAELLLVAVRSIRPYALDVFHAPVSLEEYPDYKDFVVKPFDLQQLEQFSSKERYSSVEEFVSDLRWIHHNSVVYNGPQNRISSSAVAMLKAADKEIGEMSLCPQCYLHMRKATAAQNQNAAMAPAAGTAPPNGCGSFFSEVCCPPHVVVWAKIRGFPHWPAKVMQADGDQATVKFFGDHNKSIVSLSNCTLLTLKPPVNQKSKKGSYSTAMDEIEAYVRKFRERFGVEFRYETEQVKLTREIYDRLISRYVAEFGQNSAEDDAPEDAVVEPRVKAKEELIDGASETPSKDNGEANSIATTKTKVEGPADTQRIGDKATEAEGAAKAAAAKSNSVGEAPQHLIEPMETSEDREDDEGEEERRIKSVIISQVPLLAETEDDKDSGSEEQNSILESIKRKLNLDKKSDSTDDDKEDNGNAKDAGTKAVDPNVNLAIDNRPSNATQGGVNAREDGVNNNGMSNNTDTSSSHSAAEPADLAKDDLKLDIHPDVQLQQMQAATVNAEDLSNNRLKTSTEQTGSRSTGNAKSEKGRGAEGQNATKSGKSGQQSPQKNHHSSRTKEDKSSKSGSLGSSPVKDEGRKPLSNNSSVAKREDSSRELRPHTNNSAKGQQHQRTRTRTGKAAAGEPQKVPEDLESPASPPAVVPLAEGLAGAVDEANLLAAAIGIAGAAAAAATVQQGKTRANMRSSRASTNFAADKGVLGAGVLGAVGSLLGVEDTPKSPERNNCCAEVSSTTADTDPPHPGSNVANPNALPATTTTVIPKVASGDTFFEKLRQTIEECKEKVGVTGHLNAQLQPIAGAVIGAHPEDDDQEDEEGHGYDESETDVSDTELMPYQQKALQLPSPRKETAPPAGDAEAVLLSSAAVAPSFVHRETQTGDHLPSHRAEGWTAGDWELHYWNSPRVHPDDKRLNQELVAREMCLLKEKLKLKELAAHKAIWQATTTRMTDAVKSKQWCCVCKGLATMTCCWNTSYCSQACQSSHWPVHIKTCERSQQSSKR